jgi:hypothetical protein
VEPEGEIVTRGPVKLEESVVEVEPEGEIVTRGPVKLEEESVVEVEPREKSSPEGLSGWRRMWWKLHFALYWQLFSSLNITSMSGRAS